ncbi:hypothetical protein N7494_010424 [Penicillium frequentans]|uniref:Uncharacterized protein n=1 Tax=Penicillium frequentans TaxID=3151616 RepID=A0AAD6G9S0_9EURO|nr:hypothetical protein N7494_010424 [Penicillium glabrum]
MVKRQKGKFGSKAGDRWCVECGIKTGPGNNRYTAGNQIYEAYVVCINCREFREGASENGKHLSICQVCDTRRRRVIRATEEDR